MFKDLIISVVRIKIIELYFSSQNVSHHVRDLVRVLHEEINAVRRELAFLERKGILKKDPRGNRIYYSARRDYPFYFDLIELVAKTIGLGHEILKFRNKLGKIKLAVLSGSFVRGRPYDEKNVDLLIVGSVVVPELDILVKNEQARRSREMNYTVMSDEEFAFRKSHKDPFLQEILLKSRVMVIGDEDELVQ